MSHQSLLEQPTQLREMREFWVNNDPVASFYYYVASKTSKEIHFGQIRGMYFRLESPALCTLRNSNITGVVIGAGSERGSGDCPIHDAGVE
jgi:hypothetical protein